MDYQEAIEKHENDCRRCREKIYKYAIKKFSCLQEIDIKAYEELMSYRRIGTLEEFKKLKECEISGIQLAEIACSLNRLKDYQRIGTLEEVREAVEKQKAKEPRATNRCYVCPHCGLVTSLRAKRNYCDACGQKILWKVEEWGKRVINEQESIIGDGYARERMH